MSHFIHNCVLTGGKYCWKLFARIMFVLILNGKMYFTLKKETQQALQEYQPRIRIYGEGKWNMEIIPVRQDKGLSYFKVVGKERKG